MCSGLFSPKLFYVILSVPHPSGKGAVCIDGGLAPSGKRPGDVKSLLFLVPPDANAKGGCTMELNEVLALLTIIGGTVYITFQISWEVFKEIHNNKK